MIRAGRNRPDITILLLAVILLLCGMPAKAQDDDGTQKESDFQFKLKGNFQSLWVFIGDRLTASSYTIGTNRLRLEHDTTFRKKLKLKLIYDIEAFTGNYITSPYWKASFNIPQRPLLDLTSGYHYDDATYLRHSLYRAYLTYEGERARIYAGKQRVSWGVMRFWRPTDIFNPESPLQVEGGERPGIDAIRVTAPLGKADIDVLYAPSRYSGPKTKAAKLHFVSGDYDISAMSGRVGNKGVSGFTFDGYVGKGGLRGEILHVRPDDKKQYSIWTIGADYSFRDSITLTAEYLSNGGAGDVAYNPYMPYDGIIATRHGSFLGVGVSAQISPLIKASVFTSYDLQGKSAAISPRISWDYRQNLELSAGTVITGGKHGGEYSDSPGMLFLQAKQYF